MEAQQHIGTIKLISVGSIRRFQGQPRTYFDEQLMQELQASLEEEGQETPIKVRALDDDPEHAYELIDGERRWTACKAAGIDQIIAWITQVKDAEDQFAQAVIANFGHASHTPLETAYAIARIMKRPDFEGLSKQASLLRVARMFTRSHSWVEMHLDLLKLDPEVLGLMEPARPPEKRLGISMATYLLTIPDPGLQKTIANAVVEKGLKIRQARQLAKAMAKEQGQSIGRRPRRASDDREMIESFVGRLTESIELVLDMPAKRLKELFAGQTPERTQALVEQVTVCITGLTTLQDVLQRELNRKC